MHKVGTSRARFSRKPPPTAVRTRCEPCCSQFPARTVFMTWRREDWRKARLDWRCGAKRVFTDVMDAARTTHQNEVNLDAILRFTITQNPSAPRAAWLGAPRSTTAKQANKRHLGCATLLLAHHTPCCRDLQNPNKCMRQACMPQEKHAATTSQQAAATLPRPDPNLVRFSPTPADPQPQEARACTSVSPHPSSNTNNHTLCRCHDSPPRLDVPLDDPLDLLL